MNVENEVELLYAALKHQGKEEPLLLLQLTPSELAITMAGINLVGDWILMACEKAADGSREDLRALIDLARMNALQQGLAAKVKEVTAAQRAEQ